jgi:hypothetical protein
MTTPIMSASNRLPVLGAILEASLKDREQLRRLLRAHPSVDLKTEFSALREMRESVESSSVRLLFCELGKDPAEIFAWLANRPPTLDADQILVR